MMNEMISAKAPTKDTLLHVGRSWKILSLTVIVLLSLGLAVVVYGQLGENATLAGTMQAPLESLRGFGFLMLLTVGYLVGKSFSAGRDQKRLIEHFLEEEATGRALRLNPITQFHHPEVCRDILVREANHAARLQAPVTILEFTFADLGKRSHNPEFRPFAEGLTQQLKRVCRPIDTLLRWSADSFLLVFPEVTRTEFPAIRSRICQELSQWCEQNRDSSSRAELLWRSFTTDNLAASGDVLLQTQRLLEEQERSSKAAANPTPLPSRRAKSVGLSLALQVHGRDQQGNSFQEAVVTERVATDRIWFILNKNLEEKTLLTIASPDGAFQHAATVISLVERGEDHVVEARFNRPPENWVVR